MERQNKLNKQADKSRPDIIDYILTGRENAKTATEIAEYVGLGADRLGPRKVTKMIELARKAGAPICASSDGQTGGFYLAADQDELNEYLGRLESRHRTIGQTIEGMRRGQHLLH